MNTFGWSYPPGAAGDPNAPWNQQVPECRICDEIAHTSALEDGYPLCEEHDTEENRLEWDQQQYDEGLGEAVHAAIESGGHPTLGAEQAAVEKSKERYREKHGPRPGGDETGQ